LLGACRPGCLREDESPDAAGVVHAGNGVGYACL
jgi:hypothetical protein